jgi:hypothetical protein
MSDLIIEKAIGAIDGVNDQFTTSKPYVSGNIHITYNGLLVLENCDDGWIPTNPATGEFQLRFVPRVGDIIQVIYEDATSLGEIPVAEITKVNGKIRSVGKLSGKLRNINKLSAKLNEVSSLKGKLLEIAALKGSVKSVSKITGKIREVC